MGLKQTTLQPPRRLHPPIKGVVTRIAETKLPDGGYSMLRNIELVNDVGLFSMRRGTKQFNSTSLGSTPIRGGIRWSFGSTPTLQTVFGHGDKLYRLATVPVAIGTGYTSDREWFFASFTDYLFCTNGTNVVQRWDGTTMRAAGFAAPGSAPTVATGAAGVLTGAYKYKVTFIYDSDSSHESSASVASSTVNPAGQQVDLSSIPTGGTGCTSRKLYRTKAGGALYYELTTIVGNVATTYSDNIADASLGLTQAPVDNGIPPAAQYILIDGTKGRCFMAKTTAKKNRLYFSAIASTERNPTGTLTVHGAGIEIFPADHWIDIGADNSVITGLAFWGDNLVVFTETEIYLVRGQTAGDLGNWNTGNNVGCVAPRSIVNMGLEDGIYFLGRGETTPTVYSFTGGRVVPISDAVEPTFRSNLIGLGSSYTVQPAAGSYRGQYLLSYAYAATPTYEVAKFDGRARRWSFDRNVSPSCWISYTRAGDAGEVFFGHAIEGWVVQWDVDGGDFTESDTASPTDAEMHIETGWMDLGSPFQQKDLLKVYIMAESQDTAKITVERRYDFKTSGTITNCDAKPMASSINGRSVFAYPVPAEFEGGDEEVETGYFVKLLITISVPYENTGDSFLPVRLHDIVLVYNEQPPTEHYGTE